MFERELYCKNCYSLLVQSDASHMLFNKSEKIKKDFLSCENSDCHEQNIIIALIKKE